MKELEETNCEIRNVINFEFPLWNQLDNLTSQDELVSSDGQKESNYTQASGGFLNNDCKHAWLSHGTRLVVVDVKQGRCISSWTFTNKITSVSTFPSEPGQIPLLLVGLDNNAIRIKDSIGYLCIFDCCISTILTTIQVPAGVEKACIIHGGSDWEEYNEKRPDTVLNGNSGLIFAALRNLQHIVIDINRHLWENAIYEGKIIMAKLEFVNTPSSQVNPVHRSKKEHTHLAYDLMDREIEQYMGFDRHDFEATPLYDESLCSVLLSSTKIGCLITGCLGRVIIWQNDGSIGWISPAFDENAYVTHVALLEPSDDPRPFYYLWIACQSDANDSSAVIRMYAMLFNKKLCDKSGESSLYFDLESEPSLKFELELERGERVHSLLAVERDSTVDGTTRRAEDSLLLIGTDERLLMFDLNRWYKEQMPRTMAECRNPNSVMASYRTKSDDGPNRSLISCGYVPRSLREFPTKGPSSPEELFYPNSLTLEWIELAVDGLTFWLARGVQAELLREITIAGPIALVKPTETYRRCLAAGLVPFDSLPQDYPLDADRSYQREMLLSLCLEQRWASFLIRCATEWSDGSASYLYPEFLRWGVQRASDIKLIADRFCVPLFDQSGSNIGEAELKTLRFCAQQLECLGTVVAKLPNLESDLERQRRALNRIATYLQVLLWFYDVGLLPESQEIDEEEDMPHMTLSTKIPYPRDKLVELYKRKRDVSRNEENNDQETLFIDLLISQDCEPLKAQWEREAGHEFPNQGGHYPPPSLQSLLRSYLTDCHRDDNDSTNETERDLVEMESKHSITIYVLMDLAMLLQGTYPAVDRLIKYPSAFKLSPSLIKLTQAFWLLDHEDYEGFFKIITGQLTSSSDIKDWHHKLAISTLLRNDQHKLALTYMRVMKPPLSSLDDQSTIIGLSVEQDLIESAFHARPPSHYAQLLTRFFQACHAHGKLKKILHLSLDSEEEEAFIKFLKESGCEETRLLYYLQRCRHIEANDILCLDNQFNISRRSVAPQSVQPLAMKILNAFHKTLPDITRRFANNLGKLGNIGKVSQQTTTDASRGYPRPMSHCRDRTREIYEVAVNKTRETCLKATDRTGNLLPFLGAPCSTIAYCSRAYFETNAEVNCVLFPEKRLPKGKRTLGMMNDGEDNSDSAVERKKRKLGNETDANLSCGDNESQLPRRLSMSQVCDTPLVQRKARPLNGRDTNGLAAEPPHSILKIRQMLRRNSNSPGFSFNNSSCEKDVLLKRTPAGDSRPARQIRFSMDRFSNDDSLLSANNSTREENEQDSNNTASSKNAEEESCYEDSYYSPNVSVKSARDSSFLSDSSMTKNARGPRPRPGLRRSSLLSRTSSDYQSNKTTLSESTMMEASALEATPNKSKPSNLTSLSPRRSILSSTLYCASILSPNTSSETSPLRRPCAFNNNEEDQSMDSDSKEEEEESVTELNDTSVEKDMSVESPSVKGTQEYEEEEEDDRLNDDEIETQDEDDDKVINRTASVNCSPSENFEISEDETRETAEQAEDETEEENGDQDDTFKSLSNSVDEPATSELVNRSHELKNNINRDTNYSLNVTTTTNLTTKICTTDNTSMRVYNYEADYSLTKNIELKKPCDASYSEGNYSLTKPIFLDNRGIVRCNQSVDITDDESNDEEIKMPTLSESVNQPELGEEGEEEAELTLNFSASDGSDGEKMTEARMVNISPKKSEKNVEERLEETNEEEYRLEKETSSVASELSDPSIGSTLKIQGQTTPVPKKASSLTSLAVTKSEEIGDDSTPLRRSTRQVTSSIRTGGTPRRSIKAMSTSPLGKSRESVDKKSSSQKAGEQETRSTLVTKEVKKILSKVIREPPTPEKSTQQMAQSEEELGMKRLQESPTPKSPIVKSTRKSSSRTPSRTPSRQSSREPSQDKTVASPNEQAEESVVKKRSTRTAQKVEATEAAPVAEKTSKARGTRAGSTAKTTDKPTRMTRGASVASESEVEVQTEEPMEKKPTKSKSTRASSMAKDTTVSKKELIVDKSELHEEHEKSSRTRATRASSSIQESGTKTVSTPRKTRAGSLAKDEEKIVATEDKPARKTRAGSIIKEEDKVTAIDDKSTRRTRAASLAKDEETTATAENKTIRKTRAGSVTKDERQIRAGSVAKEERQTRAGSVAKDERQTRASSIAKEEEKVEETRQAAKRTTRASSLAKEVEVIDDVTSKRMVRKRGSSVPKEVPTGFESSKLTSRSRRSTSLLKEVILEESLSQLDSPATNKRSRAPIATNEVLATSSPAANTRSRRSSIQSMPEELEDILSVPKRKQPQQQPPESRSRRAASVDSDAKRLTRSVLAKTAIIEDVIPEEPSQPTKLPARRKRATSVTVDAGDEDKEKEKAKGTKPKRGRKTSVSKDYQFSAPEEAGVEPDNNDDECRTPTFKFSEPTGLQKFISPIVDYEESSDVTTNVLRRYKTDSERLTSARIQRRPRTCFVLPKKTKDKAN